MPLQRTDQATAFTDPSTSSVVFEMNDLDLDRPVRVTVQTEALLKLNGGANPLSAFELNRDKIEDIASAKFDRQGGGEIVVRVDDVATSANPRRPRALPPMCSKGDASCCGT